MNEPWEMSPEEYDRFEHLGNGLANVRDGNAHPISFFCPRCGHLVEVPLGNRPCRFCQIKALEGEVKRLRGKGSDE